MPSFKEAAIFRRKVDKRTFRKILAYLDYPFLANMIDEIYIEKDLDGVISDKVPSDVKK